MLVSGVGALDDETVGPIPGRNCASVSAHWTTRQRRSMRFAGTLASH